MEFADRFVQTVPATCFSRVTPTPVCKPELLAMVPEVAELIGGELPADVLGGNRLLPGMVPYAACYGGHQFGTWAGQLGDGRAITLGEVGDWEVQLKGAGRTIYSRNGDGRAVLRSSLRELVCSEAMHHLGIPTTRALSLVKTGEVVMRDMLYDGNPRHEPGAITCRVAPTFLRFGSFEIHTARDDKATLDKLVRYTLERYFPGKDVAGMFAEVCARTAWLVSEWMRVGFVHGVMNTDNMSILGLTIDYGPYGWLESYDLDWTPNTTDASGRRYRYGAQPQIAQWNLAQLARALAPVAGDLDPMRRTLDRFAGEVTEHHRHTMLRKLGLVGRGTSAGEDDQLLVDLYALLADVQPDFTLWFRHLATATTVADLEPAFYGEPTQVQRAGIASWLSRYRRRTEVEEDPVAAMNSINPLYVPRNYLVHEVIEATEGGDRSQLAELLDVLRRPYTPQPGRERYAAKRPAWALNKAGCSMLSCSS